MLPFAIIGVKYDISFKFLFADSQKRIKSLKTLLTEGSVVLSVLTGA